MSSIFVIAQTPKSILSRSSHGFVPPPDGARPGTGAASLPAAFRHRYCEAIAGCDRRRPDGAAAGRLLGRYDGHGGGQNHQHRDAQGAADGAVDVNTTTDLVHGCHWCSS